MSLFELLKHFRDRFEPVATVVIPGLVITLLFLLPFLDRRADREPGRRPLVISSFVFVFAGIAFLTVLGFRARRGRHRRRTRRLRAGRRVPRDSGAGP